MPSQATSRPTPDPNTREWTRDIRCYKCQGRGHVSKDCPNSKQVLFTDQGYVSDGEETPEDVGSAQVEEEFEYNDEDVEYVTPDVSMQPLALVTMRTLHLHESPPADQRENIFHTRCNVKGQSLCVIIDGGSCCNLINKKVVEHLQLPTTQRTTS